MRLQVSVRRHYLPAVNIIFTTGTGPSSKTLATNSTVTDLLCDVSDLVQLESADGEWGLEDYVVEVQATADQETYYECLHYQTIESVLREDDEVIIRCMGTEDLRRARLGGRHQISADGRHLIDGVAFGRQWLRKGGRPAMTIPPRKRRRLEIDGDDEGLDEDSTTLLAQLRELGYSNEDYGEDDENDDDFEDDVNSEEADEASNGDQEEQPLRIKATAEFDDADIDEDDESEEDSESDAEDAMAGTGLELSDELKALLVDAEQLSGNDIYLRLPSEATQSPRKRKRDDASVEEQEAEHVSEFEGFSTPTKPAFAPPSLRFRVSSPPMSEDEPASLVTDSDSSSDDAADSTDTSSSGTSDSGNTSSIESSDDDSDDGTSSSEPSSDSSNEGSTNVKDMNLANSSPAKRASSQARSSSDSSISISSTTSPKGRQQAAPGQGLKATHRNNQRGQRRLRLARLKQAGFLHADANFADMAAFDEHNAQFPADDEEQVDSQEDFESKKAALLLQLDIGNKRAKETNLQAPRFFDKNITIVDGLVQKQTAKTNAVTINTDSVLDRPELNMSSENSVIEAKTNKEKMAGEDSMEVDEIVPSQEIGVRAQESFIGKATPKSTEKRAKLDLASSRRMLFNSLGLRNPKTPEAEQALREKLAKDINRMPERKTEERVDQDMQLKETSENDMDSWKDRIVLSAVECEYEGVTLSTPPFPFKQGWDNNANMRRGTNKKKGRKQAKHYNSGDDYDQEYAPDVSTLQTPSQDTALEQDDRPNSRTLSLEEQEADEMPRPSEFGSLLNLSSTDLVPGAVIAFKELDIKNFQPEVSEYRVARVRAIEIDDAAEMIEVMLSRKDWPVACEGSDPFAIEDEDKQPEDGLRIKRFTDLIEPKLIEASSVQVNATPAQTFEKDNLADLTHAQCSVVPESMEADQRARSATSPKSKILTMTHIEVNTPRRDEITAIIKEAGFESAIDQDLLQPREELEEPQSSPAFHTRSHQNQLSSHDSVPGSIVASTTNLTQPRFDSPGLNGWDSSPLRQIQADSSLVEPSEASPQPTPFRCRPETQSSIAYPALSQLDIDASGVTVTNESSFQDAQRVSPPPDLDTSALRPDLDTSKLHPEYPYDDYGNDDSQASPGSEVPQSQSPQPLSHDAPTTKSAKSSFLGRGLDGEASSDEESDYSDNSSLASLRELTSSQHNKIKHASRRANGSPPAIRPSNAIISPPPVRGRRLRNGKMLSTSPEKSESDDGVELPPTKNSQNQAPQMSHIVDLTFSSSPSKPQSDGDYQVPKTRGAKAKKNSNVRMKKSQSSGSISFDDDAEEEAPAGIGKRRFLTTKKWGSKSQV